LTAYRSYLAKDLVLGVCPRLSELNLAWNGVGARVVP
jgi:hypothetical protein